MQSFSNMFPNVQGTSLLLICSWPGEQADWAFLSCWEAAALSLPRVHDPMTQRFDRNSSAPWRRCIEKINTLTSHTPPHKDAHRHVPYTWQRAWTQKCTCMFCDVSLSRSCGTDVIFCWSLYIYRSIKNVITVFCLLTLHKTQEKSLRIKKHLFLDKLKPTHFFLIHF